MAMIIAFIHIRFHHEENRYMLFHNIELNDYFLKSLVCYAMRFHGNNN